MVGCVKFQHFLEAQNPVIATVLDELRGGTKRTHWMWFVFPQHVGLGRSAISKYYGLESVEAASAYLDNALLCGRLVACTEAVLANRAKSAREIFGTPDDLKFRSCMTIFATAAPHNSVFQLALNTFFSGRGDRRTLTLLV